MKFIKKLIITILVIIILSILGLGIYGYTLYQEKIEEQPLSDKVSDIKNDYFYVSINDVPEDYINAIIAVEDHRYNEHGAIDIMGISRALFNNIKNKEIQEGGSTITQQVAKNLYFMTEDNAIRRKVAELFMAIKLEDEYKKEEILEMYINTIYFGDGYYGIKQACRGYLNKEPSEMNLSELTMMAGVPNAPSVYSPTANKELCKQRQNKVVSSMVEYGYITEEQATTIDQSFIDEIN